MPIYLKDGKILLNSGKVATNFSCCCFCNCGTVISRARTNGVTLTISGFTNLTTSDPTFVQTCTYAALNGSYHLVWNPSTSLYEITLGTLCTFANAGTKISDFQRIGGNGAHSQLFAWKIQAGLVCTTPDTNSASGTWNITVLTHEFSNTTANPTLFCAPINFGALTARPFTGCDAATGGTFQTAACNVSGLAPAGVWSIAL